MYKEKDVYFISNLTNLNNKFYQFLENDSNSLSGQVISFKDKVLPISLPKVFHIFGFLRDQERYHITWKINVKKILSKDCFVKFIFVNGDCDSNEICWEKNHILEYEDVSKLEGLGWIEYTIPFSMSDESNGWVQPSIELKNHSIILQIDYVRLIPYEKEHETIYFTKMGHPLPIHKSLPNVPEAFKDKFFSKKEMENLIELKDILN